MEGSRFKQLICWLPCWSGISPTGNSHASMCFLHVLLPYCLFLLLTQIHHMRLSPKLIVHPGFLKLKISRCILIRIFNLDHLHLFSLYLPLHSCIHKSTLSLFLGSAAREVVLAQQRPSLPVFCVVSCTFHRLGQRGRTLSAAQLAPLS